MSFLGKALGFDKKTDPPPAPPKVTDKKVVERKEKERLALAARQGFNSSILTGPQGADDSQGQVVRKQLLGQ